jgi:hypothetical protein
MDFSLNGLLMLVVLVGHIKARKMIVRMDFRNRTDDAVLFCFVLFCLPTRPQ